MNAQYALLGILNERPNYGYELKKMYDKLFGQDKAHFVERAGFCRRMWGRRRRQRAFACRNHLRIRQYRIYDSHELRG